MNSATSILAKDISVPLALRAHLFVTLLEDGYANIQPSASEGFRRSLAEIQPQSWKPSLK